MYLILKLISILSIVTIYNIQETKCGDDFARLNYNILDDLIAKYYPRNEDNELADNQLFAGQISDDDELKVSPIFLKFFSILFINALNCKFSQSEIVLVKHTICI